MAYQAWRFLSSRRKRESVSHAAVSVVANCSTTEHQQWRRTNWREQTAALDWWTSCWCWAIDLAC